MTFRLQHLQAFKAIAAAAFVAMLFVLAPSAAKAHAGHSHSHATAQQALKPDAVKQAQALQELKAAPVSQTSPKANDCSDRGCCDSGPCTGCHGFLLVAVPHPMPPLMSRLLVTGGAPPHLSPQIYRLQRPPKSFV